MENKKYKILALFGKSGAGKDTIKKWLTINCNMDEIISCTTRPMRDYEKDGIDYHFLSNEKFAQKVLDLSMLEATCFNNWFYGTPLESLNKDKVNVGVFNIQGIECLIQDPRLDVVPVYIYSNDKIRLIRNLEREKNPNCQEICRRFLADEQDFSNIDFSYVLFNNNGGTIKGFYSLIDLPEVRNLIG